MATSEELNEEEVNAENNKIDENNDTTTSEEQPNALNMSDEDFNKLPSVLESNMSTNVEPVNEDTDKDVNDENQEIDSETKTEEDNDKKVSEDIDEEKNKSEETLDTEDKKPSDENAEKEFDYEAEYKKILAPFKANNTEMHVENVEDAITLMKMGANYNKKMRGLKPHMKIIKMLDNNDLLDEDKLNFLIELDKKDPDAITKLIKDSGIDPLNVDVETKTDYQPKTYTVDDKEVELDAVLEDIQDTPAYADTIDIISNKWDQNSKQLLFNEPAIIKVINEHVESGVYNEIASVMERDKALGKLNGVSDLEAYKITGERMQANNEFNSQKNSLTNVTNNTEVPSQKQDPAIRDRKKAASSTKNSPTNKKDMNNYNPLALSDEEFEKMTANTFLR